MPIPSPFSGKAENYQGKEEKSIHSTIVPGQHRFTGHRIDPIARIDSGILRGVANATRQKER
jgi:hypothetical protein